MRSRRPGPARGRRGAAPLRDGVSRIDPSFHTAIDLIDEACAKLKNELTSKPTILDEVDRRIIQLEMERLSIKSDVEKNANAKQRDADAKRLQNLEADLLRLYDEQADLTARWKAEREAVLGVNELQERVAEVQLEIEKAEREYDLNKAAELKYGTLPELEAQLEAARTKEEAAEESAEETGEPMLRDEVVPDGERRHESSARARVARSNTDAETHVQRSPPVVRHRQRDQCVDWHTVGQIARDREGTRPHHGGQVEGACGGAGRSHRNRDGCHTEVPGGHERSFEAHCVPHLPRSNVSISIAGFVIHLQVTNVAVTCDETPTVQWSG